MNPALVLLFLEITTLLFGAFVWLFPLKKKNIRFSMCFCCPIPILNLPTSSFKSQPFLISEFMLIVVSLFGETACKVGKGSVADL